MVWTGCGPWLPSWGLKNRTELDLKTLFVCNKQNHMTVYVDAFIQQMCACCVTFCL
ncbi:hypothetical protein L208DRAFT_743402 [Tricholoma matsutake]|nr:hypothetical protein L208DRAFT_743402 [Tricholoma matsutake 945]